MKRRLALASVFAVLWLAVSRAEEQSRAAWQPDRTWVFLASVVEWKDKALDKFEGPRLDGDLVQAIVKAGVPESHVTFLKDEKATLAAIREQLAATAEKAGPGSTFIFYFQGHGDRQNRRTILANYDVDTNDMEKTGLTVDEVGDILDKRWKGERLLLLGDCCHSGGLAALVPRFEKKQVKTGVLTSATASNRSTTHWTFTEALIDAFAGDGWLDRDHDGKVTFDEADLWVHDEMKFAEGQLTRAVRSSGFEQGFVLRSVPKERVHEAPKTTGTWKVGDWVEALDQEKQWYGARVIDAKPDSWLVHFPGWDPKWDEWVSADRLRKIEKKKLELGKRYEVEYESDQWYHATVLRCEEDWFWFVHYSGEIGEDDEWVTADRVRPIQGEPEPSIVPATPRKLGKGDAAAARWKKEWYLAKITAVDEDGLRRVRYADDSEGGVLDDELVPLATADELAVGDRVLACWDEKPRMFLGTVTAKDKGSATVKWDDGSPESSVAVGKIARVKTK
jgi:hypothetical protein